MLNYNDNNFLLIFLSINDSFHMQISVFIDTFR